MAKTKKYLVYHGKIELGPLDTCKCVDKSVKLSTPPGCRILAIRLYIRAVCWNWWSGVSIYVNGVKVWEEYWNMDEGGREKTGVVELGVEDVYYFKVCHWKPGWNLQYTSVDVHVELEVEYEGLEPGVEDYSTWFIKYLLLIGVVVPIASALLAAALVKRKRG